MAPSISNTPEYIEMINFLIAKTKDAKSPLNVTHLAEEFKTTSGSSQRIPCLLARIYTYRSIIYRMNTIDTETKVKMLFALGGPIDENFLNELRNDAHVEVDANNRITRYKANDGSLELEGDHSLSAKKKDINHWENGPEYVELMNFLIERTKDAKSPLNIAELAREYKEKSGSSQTIPYLVYRIRMWREKAAGLDTMDTETKVKVIFALSASIDENFLNELRKDAHVEVDQRNRITKYKRNDGSLELEKEHKGAVKKEYVWDGNDQDGTEVDPNFRRRSAMSVKKELPVENSEIVITKSGRVSKKKSFDDEEIDHYHDSPLQKKRKTGSMSSRRFPIKQEYQNTSRTDLKPFRRYIKKELMNPMDKGIQGEASVKVEDPMEVEDVKPKFTSKLKFLEAIKSLVDSLDTPTLSRIQSKIQQKIWKTGHSNFGISNDEMIPAMDLLVARIANHSFSDLSETDKSVSFKEFLCYLKAVILNSKLEGLEGLLEKIKEKNKTLALRDKRVSVEKVASVLQDTLNNVGF
ncbi:hypothetical protein CAEBREN_22846 [Caenorhabditis brenneri]|uniref:SPK domain-containing protein n=1 Tax=Caenorhabditis brenneri TaxID=135651 RepID=G0P3G8_CAEBE|nr:hypothetical protein CAEBREN_22846 [Caenorhabditis brenneri]